MGKNFFCVSIFENERSKKFQTFFLIELQGEGKRGRWMRKLSICERNLNEFSAVLSVRQPV
jgi:hypothetical protein